MMRSLRHPFALGLAVAMLGLTAPAHARGAGLLETFLHTGAARIPATQLVIEPASGAAPVVRVIDSATRSVDINAYELTSYEVENALDRAGRRGVRVRVILELHPFGSDRAAEEAQAWCAKEGRLVSCQGSPTGFQFDHAKYLVADGTTGVLGTANFSGAAFTKNREYLYISRDPALAGALQGVFDADWTGSQEPTSARQVLILSPGAQPAFMWLLTRPGDVAIETEEFGYVASLADALAAKGRALRIIVPRTLSDRDRETLAQLQAHAGVQVRFLSEPYMHAKLILTASAAFIGSVNMSDTSLNRNREVGVILGDTQDLGALRAQFDADWKAAE